MIIELYKKINNEFIIIEQIQLSRKHRLKFVILEVKKIIDRRNELNRLTSVDAFRCFNQNNTPLTPFLMR